jgi:anti-anti-sigma factor
MSENAPEVLLRAELERNDDRCSILRLVGEVDISTAHILAHKFTEIVQDRVARLVIDATGITFMDSTGLHALVEGKRATHENGTKIYLVPSPQVRRVLELVFPDPLFAARLDSVDEAFAAIDRSSLGDVAG